MDRRDGQMRFNLGIQLYSVRDHLAKDFLGTMRKVAGMGYRGFEFAGLFDTPAEEIKAVLEETGVTSIGEHAGLPLLESRLDATIDFNRRIGSEAVICPYAKCETYEEYKGLADFLTEAGRRVNDAGMKMAYHNHAHELQMVEGKHGLDLLFELADPDIVIPQFDVCWIANAGLDPVAYIGKYAGREFLLHLKDYTETDGKFDFTEVGNGIVDCESVVRKGMELGVKWFSVEQDRSNRDSLESAAISYENIRQFEV